MNTYNTRMQDAAALFPFSFLTRFKSSSDTPLSCRYSWRLKANVCGISVQLIWVIKFHEIIDRSKLVVLIDVNALAGVLLHLNTREFELTSLSSGTPATATQCPLCAWMIMEVWLQVVGRWIMIVQVKQNCKRFQPRSHLYALVLKSYKFCFRLYEYIMT